MIALGTSLSLTCGPNQPSTSQPLHICLYYYMVLYSHVCSSCNELNELFFFYFFTVFHRTSLEISYYLKLKQNKVHVKVTERK